MAKRVWYPGPNARHEHHKEPQFSLMLQYEVKPGWNEVEDDDIAQKLVASGLCSFSRLSCLECDPKPAAVAPAAPVPTPDEAPPETAPRSKK